MSCFGYFGGGATHRSADNGGGYIPRNIAGFYGFKAKHMKILLMATFVFLLMSLLQMDLCMILFFFNTAREEGRDSETTNRFTHPSLDRNEAKETREN